MSKLVTRLIIWGASVAVALAIAAVLYLKLDALRHPRENFAASYLKARLGDMTAPQEKVVARAIEFDPLLAILTVRWAHSRNIAPWQALEALPTQRVSPEISILKLSLSAGLDGEITKNDAARFADSATDLVTMLQSTDPAEGAKVMHELERCPRSEYSNVATDPSYALLAPRIDQKYRDEFRRNQSVLTPVLSMAAPEEWDHLLNLFQQAQPRAGEILADPKLGRAYGLIYVYDRDLVRELEQSGVSEQEAIEFVGVNSATIREFKKRRTNWTATVERMRNEQGPDEKSFFTSACADPAVFWLISKDESSDGDASRKILARYAGTELPAVLLKFRDDRRVLDAAIESLVRFDNEADPNPAKRQSAARLLSHYQDSEAFREGLAQHGAVLIPALSAGGQDALAQILKNPHDIRKYVDENGNPRGSPWWTWIPGGNIAYAIHERVQGRTVTWGELGWAAVDLVFLVPLAGEVGGLAGKALVNGEKAAAEGLVRGGAETGLKDTEEILIKGVGRSGGELVVESVAKTAQIGITAGSRSLLARAGTTLSLAAAAVDKLAEWVVKSGWKYAVATAAVLYTVSDNFRNYVNTGVIEGAGRAVAGVPGHFIAGIWDELQGLARQNPMLAPLFYLLAAALIAWAILMPLYLLKKLLYPVYVFVMGPVWAISKWLKTVLQGRPAGAAVGVK